MKQIIYKILIPTIALIVQLIYLPELFSAQSSTLVALGGAILVTSVLTLAFLSINIKNLVNSLK